MSSALESEEEQRKKPAQLIFNDFLVKLLQGETWADGCVLDNQMSPESTTQWLGFSPW